MEIFIKKSKNKFNNFNYHCLSYKSTKQPITLICNIHNHKFIISTRNHLNSKYGGCKKCNIDNRFLLLINKSNKKFNNNYTITKKTFINYQNTIEIKCKKHNYVFNTYPQSHIKSINGCCIYCDNKDRYTETKKYIDNCNLKFNNNFNYPKLETLNNQNQIIEINCKAHNLTFKIKASLHYQYKHGGCKKCTTITKQKRTTKKRKKNNNNITLKNDEIFKKCNINGFENFYKISNYGNIFSIRTNKYMRSYKNKNGYKQIRLTGEEKNKIFRIHYLVATHFIDNYDNKKYIDHINRIRHDNYYKNLRWVTCKENMNNISRKKNNRKLKNNDTNKKFKKIGMINNYDFSDYFISNNGDIINKFNKLLNKHKNGGYYNISLKDKITNKRKNVKVHRLVAYKYCQKNNNTNIVNHIDNNRLNNYYKNLEWCNNKYNTREYFKKKILQIDIKTNRIINTFTHYVDIYKFLNKSYGSGISKCCNGYANTAFGYIWKLG